VPIGADAAFFFRSASSAGELPFLDLRIVAGDRPRHRLGMSPMVDKRDLSGLVYLNIIIVANCQVVTIGNRYPT